MKNISILLFLLLAVLPAFSQDNCKLYEDESGENVILLFDNNEYCPVSIELTVKVKNIKCSFPEESVIVVPAQTKAYKIGEIETINNQKSSMYKYSHYLYYGDITKKTYDENFEYYLPYPKGKEYEIYQGYNGKFSHKDEFALDFSLEVGDTITAARGGIVIYVEESNSKACTLPNCDSYSNYITIYHDDGSFSEYVHLKKNGSLVEVGQQISIGEKIGLSGNTGYSTGPHLHFECFYPTDKGEESFKTIFKTADGKKEILVEEGEYLRDY